MVQELQETKNVMRRSTQGAGREVTEAGKDQPSQPLEGCWTLPKAKEFKVGA